MKLQTPEMAATQDTIGLLIADEVQLVGGEIGPTREVTISRTRYVSAQMEILVCLRRLLVYFWLRLRRLLI